MPDNSWYDTSDVFSVPYDDVSQYSSPPEWLTPMGNVGLFDSDTFSNLGFSGNVFNTGEMGNSLSPEFSSWMNQNNYNITPSSEGFTTLTDGSGRTLDKAYGQFDDPWFGALPAAGVAAVTGGALGGGGFAGSLGVSNPAFAGALNQGLAGGMMAGGSGGNFFEGFGQGAFAGGAGGAINQLNPAKYAGISNPTLQGIANRGIGSAGTTYALTGDADKALQSGGIAALQSGLNAGGKMAGDFFRNLFSSDSSGDGLYDLPGNMVTPEGFESVAPPELYSDEGGRFGSFDLNGRTYETPSQFFSGAEPVGNTTTPIETETPLARGLAGRLGGFALNNAGDLASMLYGIYNNRKQQKALGQQISGLQNMYSQNSPYAQQLRNKLAAQASARGTRLNTAGRETQLQAALADRAASLAPSLYQMQQGKNTLQNQMLGNTLNSLNKMGAFSGLKDLFSNKTYENGGANITGVQNPYGSDIIFNGWQ